MPGFSLTVGNQNGLVRLEITHLDGTRFNGFWVPASELVDLASLWRSFVAGGAPQTVFVAGCQMVDLDGKQMALQVDNYRVPFERCGAEKLARQLEDVLKVLITHR